MRQQRQALVLRKIFPTAVAFSKSDIISWEPPLKPNQPNHKINVPKVARAYLKQESGRFAIFTIFTYVHLAVTRQ